MASFGVDLYDVYRGDVPASKVLRLLRWSPPESPFRASVAGGPERMGWTAQGPNLLADLWDLLAAVNTEKGRRTPTHPRGGKPRGGGTALGDLMKNRLGKGRGDG